MYDVNDLILDTARTLPTMEAFRNSGEFSQAWSVESDIVKAATTGDDAVTTGVGAAGDLSYLRTQYLFNTVQRATADPKEKRHYRLFAEMEKVPVNNTYLEYSAIKSYGNNGSGFIGERGDNDAVDMIGQAVDDIYMRRAMRVEILGDHQGCQRCYHDGQQS